MPSRSSCQSPTRARAPAELARDLGDRVALMKAALSRAVPAHQRSPEVLKLRGGRLVGMAVDERVERLEQHLAVARSAEPPAGAAEGDVLASVGPVAELIAGQPCGRAQALE